MRRMFWLSLGAVIGVTGYRRVTTLARSLRPQPPRGSLAGFASDVREGMALYLDRQAARAPANLEGHPRRSLGPAGPAEPGGTPGNRRRATSRNDELKDGR